MTLSTANPDLLCDAELLAAWRPSERLAPAGRDERRVVQPADFDAGYMLTRDALAEVTVLGEHWTEGMIANARESAREIDQRGLCLKGKQTSLEEFLVDRCEAICERMRSRMLEAIDNATIRNQRGHNDTDISPNTAV